MEPTVWDSGFPLWRPGHGQAPCRGCDIPAYHFSINFLVGCFIGDLEYWILRGADLFILVPYLCYWICMSPLPHQEKICIHKEVIVISEAVLRRWLDFNSLRLQTGPLGYRPTLTAWRSCRGEPWGPSQDWEAKAMRRGEQRGHGQQKRAVVRKGQHQESDTKQCSEAQSGAKKRTAGVPVPVQKPLFFLTVI